MPISITNDLCCDCSGTTPNVTIIDCEITCPPSYCTQIVGAYCYSLAGVGSAGCPSVGGFYSTQRVYYIGICSGDTETYSAWHASATSGTYDCDDPPVAGGDSWTASMGWYCGVGPGTYGVLAEPLMILWIRGDAGWEVYYTKPLDEWSCTGTNVMDLTLQNGTGGFSFAATLTMTPCATPTP